MKAKDKRLLIGILAVFFILNIGNLGFAAEKVNLTASASSSYHPYYGPSKAIDGSMFSYWIGNLRANPWWITLDVGRMVNLEEIKLSWHKWYSSLDFDIQVSEDNQTWENVHSGLREISSQSNTAYSEFKTYKLSKKGRYVRIYIKAARRTFPVIPEIEVYASEYKDIPRKIRFQGELKDKNGLALEGAFKFAFRIYDVEVGGVPLWTETQEDVLVEDGLLDVILGSVTEIKLPFDKQYYLGLEVEEDGEMTPRFVMTTTPYAFRSGK